VKMDPPPSWSPISTRFSSRNFRISGSVFAIFFRFE